MDRDNYVKRTINPRQIANRLSIVSFFYSIELFYKGYKKSLQADDLYEVLHSCRSQQNGDQLEQYCSKYKNKNSQYSITRAVCMCFGKRFLVLGLLKFLMRIIKTVWGPLALSKLISYFSPGQKDLNQNDAIYYAIMVILLNVLNLYSSRNLAMADLELTIRIKAAVASVLYRKSLKLSAESLSYVTVGNIATIINKDLDAFSPIIYNGNELWIASIQAVVASYLIGRKIGVASVPGIVLFLVVLPLQVIIGVSVYKFRLKCSKKTDERLQLIQEILSAIRIIKLYTWESFFEKKLLVTRKEELKRLLDVFFTNVWIDIIGTVCARASFFIFLITCTSMDNTLSAELIYYILSCCSDLQDSLGDAIPKTVSSASQAYATAQRIDTILNAEELFNPEESSKTLEKSVISFNEITIEEGLNVVIGKVGSGKSAFLKKILQEFPVTGTLQVSGTLSYASQEPWLFPSTIRNNIVFAEDFHSKRYHDVLRACNLDYDLKLLPDGDNTMVGERGMNLSKGQQARVNLARAVYRQSNIYVLDDCLASLDARVADNIFRECFEKFLRNKICVFVINNLDYVQRADKTISISGDSIQICKKSDMLSLKTKCENNNVAETITKPEPPRIKKEIYHEVKKTHKVSWRIYYKYIVFGRGLPVFLLVLVSFLASQTASSYSQMLLSNWVTLQENMLNYNQTNKRHTEDHGTHRTGTLTLYIIFESISIALTAIRSFAFFNFVRVASNNMHTAMVRNVINSTMEFFDTHLIGNILNRFSKDCTTVDEYLPFVAARCIRLIFEIFGGVLLLASVNVTFLLESLFFLGIACIIKTFCTPALRDCQRLWVQTASPMIGHLNSTLEGLSTIRASNAEKVITREFERYQDLVSSSNYMLDTTIHSLSFHLELVCQLFVTVLIVQLLLSHDTSVGDAGLAVTQALTMTTIVSSVITNITDLESLMTSVERILEYVEIEQEEKVGCSLPLWPKTALVQFQNVSLTYGNTSKEILSDINFKINPKQKVAIVGRTGAGKSSIISSLFRLYKVKGSIFVNEVDIENVPLPHLRSNISVIPQDPFLFSGTLRENLDPLEKYSDDQIWKILTELKLRTLVTNLNMRIDKRSSFSVGQKQLLCLIRAILRKATIVVLDEATANVDYETEEVMLQAIQRNFNQCTVITVTHRIQPMLHCDKVIVVRDGRISEFDEPTKLLKNKNSYLHSII